MTRIRMGRCSFVAVSEAIAALKERGTEKQRASMLRYGIPNDDAFGVSVGELKKLARQIGRDHELALGLWETGIYEARMLAGFVDDPAAVAAGQMDSWAADFDSWAIVDHVCFNLFDRTPHAWQKSEQWAAAAPEFEKRAAFALVWALSVHDKDADDRRFLGALARIEGAAADDRLYVKKGIDMALRAVGKRNPRLYRDALAVAERLAASRHDAAAWIGRSATRELRSER